MAVTTDNTNKPILPRGADVRPIDSYNRASLYSGKALDFDGVNDSVNLDGFTMAGDVATIVFQAKFENNNYLLDLNPQRFVIRNRVAEGFQVYNDNEWEIYGSTNRDELGFYAIVSDGTTQRAYFNGVQLGNDATITALDFSGIVNFKLGSFYTTNTNFDGQIAGFKIFNTALTAAQVADLYNNPEKIVPTGVADSALKLWLPMQEGAGTTAYDGSGNGNHGTINGATYTHGIGAPLAQTAVIDWNKGTNILGYSIWNNSYWTASGGVVTDGIEAPDGTNTAFKFERDDASSGAIYNVQPAGLGSTNYRYVYAKLPSGSVSASAQLLTHNTNTNNTFTITDEWQRFEVNSAPNTAPSNFYIVDFRAGVGVDEIHLWAPQAAAGTDESVFVPTFGTAQSSEVLLPQGLTTGRDITGVNLFENVRKQGALNLDGNSWAEVHDNESLDFGTGSFSLEAWVKIENINTGAGINAIFGLGGNATAGNAAYIETNAFLNSVFRYDSGVSVGPVLTRGDWAHIVGVFDGTNTKIYSNGVLEDTDAATAVDVTNSEVKLIGRDSGGTRTYKDQIAQPRIYNRALTASEVLNNYNVTKDLYI